ncbi:MAG: hypothetical protein H6812_07015 [Phycisphaeraceae bacterium]|nr:hypothetical protein [Phycisphaerales bacterium]MCB9842991.1 hypothetical protein [Phycisphaeraceae bacterium]
MSIALDAIYAVVAAATAPWWMRKARGGWSERFGKIEPLPAKAVTRCHGQPVELPVQVHDRPRLMIHAVSVGEVNLIRPLVHELAPGYDLLITVSTDTGMARALELFAPRFHVRRYPLDASWAVRRFLDAAQPDAVALTELELWPQFITSCRKRNIPVAVVNGRLSARSFRGYRKLRFILAKHFRALAFAAVQDNDYADRFAHMGVDRAKVHTVGSMKWDAAQVTDTVEGADQLASEMGIDRSRPLIVAGSTAPGEHALLYDAIKGIAGGCQLLCAPRRPEWFDDAASALPNCVRRSQPDTAHATDEERSGGAGLFLLDTIGELRKAYALADLIVVGRSFDPLFGSDPMEPAALRKPIVIGPNIEDFKTTVTAMLADEAIVQTTTADLPRTLADLMSNTQRRDQLAQNARACVTQHQGATNRHAKLIREYLLPPNRSKANTPPPLPLGEDVGEADR